MSARGKSSTATVAPITRSARAGITFPVGRTHKQLQSGRYADRVSSTAPVYLAAVLEYITAEVLELAGSQAKANNRKRIVPKNIDIAVKADPELHSLLKNIVIEGGATTVKLDVRAMPTRARENLEKREKKRLADAMEVVNATEVVPAKKKTKKTTNGTVTKNDKASKASKNGKKSAEKAKSNGAKKTKAAPKKAPAKKTKKAPPPPASESSDPMDEDEAFASAEDPASAVSDDDEPSSFEL